MKLIAIIATAAMAVGFYTAAEATPVSKAEDIVICEQQNNGVLVCNSCNGRDTIADQPCIRYKGCGIIKANGMPWKNL